MRMSRRWSVLNPAQPLTKPLLCKMKNTLKILTTNLTLRWTKPTNSDLNWLNYKRSSPTMRVCLIRHPSHLEVPLPCLRPPKSLHNFAVLRMRFSAWSLDTSLVLHLTSKWSKSFSLLKNSKNSSTQITYVLATSVVWILSLWRMLL